MLKAEYCYVQCGDSEVCAVEKSTTLSIRGVVSKDGRASENYNGVSQRTLI